MDTNDAEIFGYSNVAVVLEFIKKAHKTALKDRKVKLRELVGTLKRSKGSALLICP